MGKCFMFDAPGQGLEPQFHAPEACVLPLDEPGMPWEGIPQSLSA